MAKEIEKKFRITNINKKLLKKGVKIYQGYLCISPEVRVRIKGKNAYITIKSEGTIARDEFEYRIPLRDAKALFRMCPWKLEKRRYKSGKFEIDVFEGRLKGLILAEIELKRRKTKVKLPSGLDGHDVTDIKKYKNKNLVRLARYSD